MLFSRKSVSRSEPAPQPPPGPKPQPRGLQPLPAAPRDNDRTCDSAGNGRSNGARSQSFIDASLTIMGDLHTDGDVQLDGRVCGNVSCAQLIVGRDAAITGTIIAEQAVIRGTITGTIRSPVVILQDTARVECEITYTVLAIDDGATFEGAARRSERPLDELDGASPLAELQRITRCEGPSHGHGENGSGPDAAGAGPPRGGSTEPAVATGRDLAVQETDSQRRIADI